MSIGLHDWRTSSDRGVLVISRGLNSVWLAVTMRSWLLASPAAPAYDGGDRASGTRVLDDSCNCLSLYHAMARIPIAGLHDLHGRLEIAVCDADREPRYN
jgi:hypothetical protein